ncbi:MAG: transporter substrate-binding protein [Devosia sp.]|nr:transporter substrate-binding protein [Devosia sp.]
MTYYSHRLIATVLGGGLTLAGLVTGAVAQTAPTDMLEIKLALATAEANFNPTTGSIFRLAEELGFYEKHGVKVTVVALEGTPQAVAALNAGAVDVADITIEAAIRLRAENDVPIRGFTATSAGTPFLVAAKDDITDVEGLVGRSFAIADNGSLDHNLTLAVLASYGIAADGPNFVAIGSPDIRVQALAAGQVDATTVSFGTYQSIADVEGIHVLVDPDDYAERSPGQSKFAAALESTIEAKREALQRFTDALGEASRAMQAEPAQWEAAMAAAREDLSAEAIAATAALNTTRWCVNGCMDPVVLGKAVEFTYANPEFAEIERVALEDLVDLSFNQKMLETLGTFEGDVLDAR